MTTDPRLRTLVSEGRGVSEATADRPSIVVDAVVTPQRLLPTEPAFDQLQIGELVAGRFQIQLLAQVGGMGAIYRAEDLLDGRLVALKTVRRSGASLERFEREAARLATLHHPGIPAYVASGITHSGQAYLAMEWLDGIDLASYIRARRLGVQTAVDLVRSVAEAVASAHEIGLVHRDLNPTNVFLVNQSPENVRVLDFGIARLTSDAQPVTEQGSRVGTPGYMAPEQVEGHEVTPATDVFALGCLLYELLTGQRAFAAPTVSEMLSRIVRDEPERPSSFNGAIPPELDEVVLGCLDKNPRRRPEHAAELVSLLGSLQGLVDSPLSGISTPSARGPGEPHITAMILLRDEPAGTYQRASQAAGPHGLRAQRNGDGTIVLVASGPGTASDHAARAARCALAVRRATRTPKMAIATGLAQIDGPWPDGRAYDAAVVALLLNDREQPGRGSTIWLDDNTATLLDSRFEVQRLERGYVLTTLRETYEPSRTVLGKKTRAVGRRRELTMLEATLSDCIEERTASAVLVTGPPGIGKSRLVYELGRRARRASQPVEILRGRADPMSAGAPFSMLIQALHRACAIGDSETEASTRSKLIDRLGRVVPHESLPRVAEFLGELIGTSIERDASEELREARRNSIVRSNQILRAFEDWLRAECAKQPVLLVLDDFHWGDLPTVKFIDSLLRSMSEVPLMVVALARPEVHDFFPKLWAQRGVTELRLGGLSLQAARDMIHDVLGPDVDCKVIERVVERAQGNPFWIEELVRAEAAGQGEDVPERVLLLAQSRIEQLNIDARRLLRAGSLFGKRFWLGGACALLGAETLGRSLDAVTRELVEAEFVSERELGRLPEDRQFEFKNGLLRDAAYSLWPEDERERAHGLAAQWLERRGDAEPLPIALHYTLGGESDRARLHYLRAAEQALAAGDLDAALSCVEEGLAAGASGQDAVLLRLVQAEACRWRGDNVAALRWARAALEQASAGKAFFRALAEVAVAAGMTGELQTTIQLARKLVATPTSRAASDEEIERAIALCRVATQLILSGERALGAQLLEHAERPSDRMHPDPRRLGYLHETRAVLAGASDDAWGRIEYADRAAEYFDDAGDARNACRQRIGLGYAQLEFGNPEEAQVSLRDALRVAERMDLGSSIAIARAHLGRAAARAGTRDEALAHSSDAVERFDRQRNLRLGGVCRIYLAEIYLGTNQPGLAVEVARRAVSLLESFAPLRRAAQAMLSLALVESGDMEEARLLARHAYGALGQGEHLPAGEDLVRLAWLEVLVAAGPSVEAQELAVRETTRLQEAAQRLPAEQRLRYLTGAPERRRIGQLARDPQSVQPLSYGQCLAGEEAQRTRDDDALGSVPHGVALHPARPVAPASLTRDYYQLGTSLGVLVDRNNLFWPSFVAWGASARAEPLHRARLFALLSPSPEGLGVHEKRFERGRHGAAIRCAAQATLTELSERLLARQRLILAELRDAFAHLVDELARDASEFELRNAQVSNAEPSEAERSELVGAALRAWHAASRADEAKLRAELVLQGNCLLARYNLERLQPWIDESRGTALDALFRQHLERELRPSGGRVWLVSFGLGGLERRLQTLWREAAGRHALNLCLPEPLAVPLRGNVPALGGVAPIELRDLGVPEVSALFEHAGPALDLSTPGARTRYLMDALRSSQQDRKLLETPGQSDD